MSDTRRHHSLDVVRAIALLLGIVLHATMSFWPGFREARWPISDDSSSLALSGSFFVIHIFRMSLFFVIAGFFAHLLLERRGVSGFVKNRLRRIALPFVAAMVVVMPLLLLPFLWAQKKLGISGPPLLTPPVPDPQMPPWGHLWFLYLLLVFYALWLAGRALLAAVDRRGSVPKLVERVLGAMVANRLAPIALAVPAAISLYYAPWWLMWQGIPAPIMGFIPNLPAVLAYGAAFAFGWFLHRRVDWLELLRRDWLLYLAVAAVSSGVALWLIGATPQLRMHALPDARRAVYAAVYNVSAWCWILGIVGGAVRHLGQPGPLWRYLADSSFFVYLVHLPVVYALQALVMRWPLHWSVKYPLIVGLATAITLALYHYLVRSTFVGTFLNGRKYPRGAAFTPAPSTFPG